MAIRKRYPSSGSSPSSSGFFLNINPLNNSSRGHGSGKKRGIARTLLILAAVLFFLSLVGGAGAFLYFSKDLPDPSSLGNREVTESSKIFDQTGKILLYEMHGEEKRTIVKLDEISPFLKNATITTEDRTFYSHEGVDMKGIVRALWRDVIARDMQQGGSTITQQLIKNSILSRERTFSRKIKEWILALQLEKKFSKDQIFEMYLNQIPYGSNAYGVEAASKTFFGKSVKDLTLGEASILAVLPKATTYYSPYGNHREELKSRAEAVIKNMQTEGYISEEDAKAAIEENALEKVKPFNEKIIAPHFVMMVKEYLADKYGDKALEKGGFNIITSLDAGKQKIAEEAVFEGIEKNSKKYNVGNAALVAVDPKTGYLLALAGSKDYFAAGSLPEGCIAGKNCVFDPNTNAAVSLLSPGSSFKPFVYATLFKKGYTSNTILFDLDTEFNIACGPFHTPIISGVKEKDCYHPDNYDLKLRGPISIRNSLAQSLNIPAVKAFYLAGINDSIELANNAGITSLKKEDNYGLALVLGGGGVKLLEETAAYGVFANDGIKKDLKMVLKVVSGDGAVLEDNTIDKPGNEVLDKNIAREITDVLSDNAARTPMFGAASPLYFPNRPVAAKTGTANDYRAAWTVGYTPSLVAGVWAGNNDNSAMNRAGGVSAAAPIWRDFMDRALKDAPIEQFTNPEIKETGKGMLDGKYDGGVTLKIDKACGDKLAKSDISPERIEERTYKLAHNILFYVNKEEPLGAVPDNPQLDPMYMNWENPVWEWASSNGYKNEIPPTEYCEVPDFEKAKVSIIAPFNNETIRPMASGGSSGFNLKIEASIYSLAGINQVNFFFDDNLIGTRSSAPWEVSLALNKNSQNGNHKISVKVFDKSNVEASDAINVVFDIDFTSPEVLMKEPICGRFDCFLGATAADSGSGIGSVDFYYQKTGTSLVQGIVVMPIVDGALYQIVWPIDMLEKTSYEVWAKAIDKRGNEAASGKKNVQVK
ncbi:transglycosylase domain-containing protein [Patescibacteria group bacterium]|nr:transglycosylase domain-containing protein [Patescibacteria group bacterium]MBU4579658.1 transglycosylase domain-containing protein [Patescibacteria group bacterium]